MISFRYHLTTLVAVFLALAVGVALGGGPLSELGRDGGSDVDTARAQTDEARTQQKVAERALAALAPRAYGTSLKDVQVAVLRMPGVTDARAAAMTRQLTAAGALPVEYRAAAGLVAPAQKSLVDTLTSQLATQMPEGTMTEAPPTYERLGELLGNAVAEPAGKPGDAKTNAVLEGLTGADLLASPEPPTNRSKVVLVLAADPEMTDGADVVHSGLVTGLARRAAGVVVATGTESELVESLRSAGLAETVVLVDGVESVTGQVASVLGLSRALDGAGGDFGASGAHGPLPLG